MKSWLTQLVFLTLFFSATCFSAPREIVIIRHADKWAHTEEGPFLSPKGQVRAERFALYYLKNFDAPDFIFATRPGDLRHPADSLSMRPVQTIAPLANELNHENKKFEIDANYLQKHYADLAHALLNNQIYQNKMVLICWHHGKINDLTRLLGVTEHLSKWRSTNYDTVYDLKYNVEGKLISFKILENQYPVNSNYTWQQLSLG